MNTQESETYRLLILRKSGSELLLPAKERSISLPSLEVPSGERVAPNLTAQMKDRWGFEVVCLFNPTPSPLPRSPVQYQVLELCHSIDDPPQGWSWFSVDSLSESSFADPEELCRIRSAMKELESYAHGLPPGTFAKPGWFREVLDWVDREIAPLGLHTTGPFRQLNASPMFSLVRIETNGPALWFKAVGEPNLREYPITLALAKSFPAFVPRIVAHRTHWNAWLAVEADGANPEVNSVEQWVTVAKQLAHLQIASFGQSLHLIETGRKDARVVSLCDHLEWFFDAMAELMECQAKPTPVPLTRPELRLLTDEVRSALEQLSSTIPNVLGHLDLNPGNVLVSEKRCVFLDWAEAFVGHPFFTFQYHLESRRRFCGTNADAEHALVSAYTRPWRSFVSPDDIAADLQVAPLLAAFAFAAQGFAWRNPQALRHPRIARCLRGLVRRMKHEAGVLPKRRATCVP